MERGFSTGLSVCAAAVGLTVLGIVVFLGIESWPAWQRIGPTAMLGAVQWNPVGPEPQQYGLAPMLVGTLAVAVGATLCAAPIGLATALYATFYASPRVSWLILRCMEVFSGIPSVVIGFWGLVCVVPWVAQLHPPGPSLLAGVLVLAVMIVPLFALVAATAVRSVPLDLIQAAHAVGLSRWRMICRIVLPAARQDMINGMVLQFGRAAGETMAVLMVCGNVVQMPGTVFDPIRTLTSNIALEMAYAVGLHRSALFAGGLVLMILVGVVVLPARWRGASHATR
ncbi:MAG: phosphate ABC transporter permease subunit PstC [Planctomycetota bacterium]|nr:MAG: phosphate ABC transporter permease subunit PstC [Planctomycetota bacterium]